MRRKGFAGTGHTLSTRALEVKIRASWGAGAGFNVQYVLRTFEADPSRTARGGDEIKGKSKQASNKQAGKGGRGQWSGDTRSSDLRGKQMVRRWGRWKRGGGRERAGGVRSSRVPGGFCSDSTTRPANFLQDNQLARALAPPGSQLHLSPALRLVLSLSVVFRKGIMSVPSWSGSRTREARPALQGGAGSNAHT